MTPVELVKRLMRGERWSVKQEPTKVEVRLSKEEIARCWGTVHVDSLFYAKLEAAKVPVVPNIFDGLRVERGVLTRTVECATNDVIYTWVDES